MIGAAHVVDIALAEAARLGGADETVVLVTDRVDAALRWANNTMTTNGESTSRTTTVISIVRRGDDAHVGSVRSSAVDPAVLADLVGASSACGGRGSRARDSAP
ncbi:TldD/PmbA family protein, partial [Mycobacterium rufum]|nr:TldD/PmbA family protein [Mycolicibacterium rufum]